MKYAEININRIVLSKKHSKDKCRSGDNFILARNIKNYGILQPIIVKPLISGEYEIVSGNRRYCASRLAGLNKIPCMVIEKGEDAGLISLSLDIFSDNNAFVTADKLKGCFIQSGESAEVIANKLGLEVTSLIELLTPTCLSDIERRIACENMLSNGIIRKISALPTREERLEALTRYIKAGERGKKIITSQPSTKVKARRRASIKGLGFFENTLKRSLELLESAGIHTEKKVEEKSGEVEYTIKVKSFT